MIKTRLILSKLLPEDIPEILLIERRIFPTPWAGESFIYELTKNPNGHYFALRCEGKICGYAGMWLIADEAHITTMAVAPQMQGRGLGELLLLQLLKTAQARRIKGVTLEVRHDNGSAISLYNKYGLAKVGERSDYYGPGSHALILWLRNLQDDFFAQKLANFELLWRDNHDDCALSGFPGVDCESSLPGFASAGALSGFPGLNNDSSRPPSPADFAKLRPPSSGEFHPAGSPAERNRAKDDNPGTGKPARAAEGRSGIGEPERANQLITDSSAERNRAEDDNPETGKPARALTDFPAEGNRGRDEQERTGKKE